jgi:hypothetical protein
MNFDGGTAYAESDADDEYERSMGDVSPVADSEASPIDSDMSTSAEHTPTTYGHRSSADRLPETIITEWTAEECADFIGSIGLQQYADRFVGTSWTLQSIINPSPGCVLSYQQTRILTEDSTQRTKSLERHSSPCSTTTSRAWASPVSVID